MWSGSVLLFGPAVGRARDAFGKVAALFGSEFRPRGVSPAKPLLDLSNSVASLGVRMSQNPPAARSTAIAMSRYFLLIVFLFGFFVAASCAHFWKLAFALERRREILVRNASEQE